MRYHVAMATFTRRQVIASLSAAPALILSRKSAAQPALPEIAKGPFDGTAESLKAFEIPTWFRDAKFGIWAHWGPQSASKLATGTPATCTSRPGAIQVPLRTYGHPSKFGYKDLCPFGRPTKFDPDHLMALYKKAGAKYFISMGVHHDNFDLWNSKHQPRGTPLPWGPRRTSSVSGTRQRKSTACIRRQRASLEQLQLALSVRTRR